MSRDRVDLLLRQRDDSWSEEYWFAPLNAALAEVGPTEAAWQPPGAGNTIWQTVNHINYWNDHVLSVFTGNPTKSHISNDATFGEPGSPDDAEGWQATMERTRQIADRLRSTLAKFTDADLDRPEGKATIGNVVTRWMLHDTYHTGQIVLMRKLQGSWPAKRG